MRLRYVLVLAPFALPAAAMAQSAADDAAAMRALRDCTRIADVPSRVACYDAAMGASPPVAARALPAPPLGTPGAPSTARVAPTPQRGFGADALPQTASAREALPQREQLRITAMRELRPRTFALTLADGGQWEFTDEAPLAYDPPRVGAAVELRRGALGSFMLEYAGQPSIRVKRVR